MLRRAFCALALSTLLAVAAVGQTPEDYLDVEIVTVKPEKRADFDVIVKKVAEANRRNNGDTWVAMERQPRRCSSLPERRGFASSKIEPASGIA